MGAPERALLSLVVRSSNIAPIALCLALACGPALAINKCTSPSGAVAYQDRPCAGAGKKVEVTPNSIAPVRNAKVSQELQAVDSRLAARAKADQEFRAAREKRVAVHAGECQGYLDEAERQRAWLNSVSEAVRQSGAAGADIAMRQYHDAGCDNPNYVP